ncbi:hypothetical protein JCM8097_008425 [Rhodosporidiobolus ruineniae]
MPPVTRAAAAREALFFTPDSTLPAVDATSTTVSLAHLAELRQKQLVLIPDHERDAQGQREELAELAAAAAAAPAPVDSPSPAFLSFVSGRYPVSPAASFPALNKEGLNAACKERAAMGLVEPVELERANRRSLSGKQRQERAGRLAKRWKEGVVQEYLAAKRQHRTLAHAWKRVEEVVAEMGGEEALKISKPGWSGEKQGYSRALSAEEVAKEELQRVPFVPGKATRVLSAEGLALVARSSEPPEDIMAIAKRLVARFNSEEIRSRLASPPNDRGKHELFLIGTTRAYNTFLHFTALHSAYPDVVNSLMDDEDLKRLSNYISSLVRLHFPRIYDRYAAADPGADNPEHPHRVTHT